jgi:hypothetical protein
MERKKNKFGRMLLNNDSLNILPIFHIYIIRFEQILNIKIKITDILLINATN